MSGKGSGDGLDGREIGVKFSAETRKFLVSKTSTWSLESNQPPIHWVAGVEGTLLGLKLTGCDAEHSRHLVPKLKISAGKISLSTSLQGLRRDKVTFTKLNGFSSTQVGLYKSRNACLCEVLNSMPQPCSRMAFSAKKEEYSKQRKDVVYFKV